MTDRPVDSSGDPSGMDLHGVFDAIDADQAADTSCPGCSDFACPGPQPDACPGFDEHVAEALALIDFDRWERECGGRK